MNLKYRLNDAYTLRDEDTKKHKTYVMPAGDTRVTLIEMYKLL